MIAVTHWVTVGAVAVPVLMILGGLFASIRWANSHIAKPLKVVTGEPETDDDPGKPSLYRLTKEAKETGEKALAISERVEERQMAIGEEVTAIKTAAATAAQLTAETASDLAAKVEATASDLAAKVERTSQSVGDRLTAIEVQFAHHVAVDDDFHSVVSERLGIRKQ